MKSWIYGNALDAAGFSAPTWIEENISLKLEWEK
jgi:hypothetical protein